MGFWDDMRGGQFRPGPGVDQPPPAGGFSRLWFLFKNHFGKLLLLNLLFWLFSLPVVTLPAALFGVNAVVVRLMREGNCFLFDDFFEGFRSRFLKKTLGGLPFVLVVAGVIFMYIAQIRGAGFYIALAVGLCFFLAACYFFPAALSDEGPMAPLMAAAFADVFRKPKTTLALLPAVLVAVLLIVFYISMLPITLLLGVSLIVLFAVTAVLPAGS